MIARFTRRAGARTLKVRAAPLALLAALACAGDEPPPAALATDVVRRDSSGIEIVEVSAAGFAALPVWRLTSEPVLTIGELDGEAPYLFGRIADAVRLSDGTIAVADGYGETGSGELRFFDAQGTFIGAAGRTGRGPGEFTLPQVVERVAGDSIAVWDRVQQKVSLLAPDGKPLREWLTAACPGRAQPDGSAPCYYPVGFLDDATLIMATSGPIYAEGGQTGPKYGQPVTIGQVRERAWTPLGTLLQGDQFWAEFQGERYRAVRPYSRLYGGRPYWAANGGFAVFARNDSSDIRMAGIDGRLVRIVRWAAEPRPVGPEDIAQYRDHDWGEERATAEAWLDGLEPGAVVPLFGELRLDEAGRLWVQDYYPYRITPGDQPRWWTVLEPDGAPLARIQLPGADAVTIYQLDDAAMLGRHVDSLSIQRIVVYGIERSGGRSRSMRR